MDITITLSALSSAATICIVCGVLSLLRCLKYNATHRDYDFFSPIAGILAFILGVVEIGLGVVLFVLPVSVGVVVLAWILAILSLVHCGLGIFIAWNWD